MENASLSAMAFARVQSFTEISGTQTHANRAVPQNGFGILEFSQLLSGSAADIGICSSSLRNWRISESPVRFRRTRWQRGHRSEPGYRKWSADVFASSTGQLRTGIYRRCDPERQQVLAIPPPTISWSAIFRQGIRTVSFGRYFRTATIATIGPVLSAL